MTRDLTDQKGWVPYDCTGTLNLSFIEFCYINLIK